MAALLDPGGSPTCVGLMGPGDLLGLSSLNPCRSERLGFLALTAGTATVFSGTTLRQAWDTNSAFCNAVLAEALTAVTTARHWSRCSRRHSARQRLAALLFRLSELDPSRALNLTQDTVSRVLNLRRPTVTTTAAELESAGAIIWCRGRTRVTDREVLSRLACTCVEQAPSGAQLNASPA